MLPKHSYTPIHGSNESKVYSSRIVITCVTFLALITSGFLYFHPIYTQPVSQLLHHDLASPSSPSQISHPDLSSPSPSAATVGEHLFDEHGRFIMLHYDENKPMSNFLCGLGGLFGVPMWTFYINRGQAIAGFGVSNKDGAIMKFNSAEKVYQNVAFVGFRTFIKGTIGYSKTFQSAPFGRNDGVTSGPKPIRSMMIGNSEMEIQEVDIANGLQTNILYFSLTDEDFPALIRQTTFKNLNSETLSMEVLDGLAKLIPAGLQNYYLDSIGRTMEAWMNVYNFPDKDTTSPFFHISQSTLDSTVVNIIKEGHFVISFIEQEDEYTSSSSTTERHDLLPFIVDPTIVFDYDTELVNPIRFWDTPLKDLLQETQTTTSRTPCSFVGTTLTLPPGASITVTSIYGHAESLETYTKLYKDKIRVKGFTKSKRQTARNIVKSVTSQVSTVTNFKLFDKYTEQSYLDNVLRGGLPLSLGAETEPKIYHVYSRIHGDLERDYNNFQLEASPFSQGPGNFRDVNQNRRIDVLINPFVGTFNVRMFFSLIQADGFNPLTVATTNCKIPADKLTILIGELLVDNVPMMRKLLSKPFRIGSLLSAVKAANIQYFIPREEFVKKIMIAADQHFAALFNQNAFWADHWTYSLDQIDSFLNIYPDEEERLLYGAADIPFYMSPALMRPRADRYLAVNLSSYNNTVMRMYTPLSYPGDPDYPKDRKAAMDKIILGSDFVSDVTGANNLWQRSLKDPKKPFTVTLITKLAMLGMIKFSSLDQSGFGIEMEGGKPGWNDAMNGLPAIIGSGMPETYEMLRILAFVRAATLKFNRGISFPVEFITFLASMKKALLIRQEDESADAELVYWDASNVAREVYRSAVNTTFTGEIVDMSASDLLAVLNLMEEKTRAGIAKSIALTPGGMSPSYFYHEATEFNTHNWQYNEDVDIADPTEFKLHTVPLFLEGPTRQLKIVPNLEDRRAIYHAVRNSGMYDEGLKMFKLSESLDDMGQDVGRMKAFSPGWLENQSVWLHMSYKFYLELLRGGLYEEFFTELSTGLIPFMKFEVYGRNPIECSSFIVSSVFPDKRLHGTGFLARLTGSTAEYMSMWSLMMTGHQPFVYEKGILAVHLNPILASWLFTDDENIVSFTFLGSIKVTYHNPQRMDTWKIQPKAARLVSVMDEVIAAVNPSYINGPLALKIRNRQIKSIDIFY